MGAGLSALQEETPLQTYEHTIVGHTTTIYFPEDQRDILSFRIWMSSAPQVVGLDTETTDLNVYSKGWACRLVQFGDADTAWVLRADLFARDIINALRKPGTYFVVHNAAFDMQVLDKAFGVTIEELTPKVFDTRIFAHLLDPRRKHEGGTGHGLKELAEIFIDPASPDTQAELHAIFRREYNATKVTGWALIDIDHPVYVRYAGLDPIFAVLLFKALFPLIKDVGLNNLSTFEHHLQGLLAIMQRKGIRLDIPYVERLRERLQEEYEQHKAVAAKYGVENINSTAQVAEALAAMGETLTETTDSGLVKVDKAVLLPLADMDLQWEAIGARNANPLAVAVLHAKRAEKWGETYAKQFLDLRDEGDRLHPMIGGLQARTARMSVSSPPLQQLPSSDWVIRRAFIADPGHLFAASDFQAVEMRVLAALSQDETMKQAIASGEDLHAFTASRVFGPDFTPQHRKISKGIGFGKVYGGGADTICRQTGAPKDEVKSAMAAYDQTFPGIKRYGKELQRKAGFGKREVITPSGRHLPLDRDRLYAATNYVVQSTARDMLAQAIVNVFDAGMGDYLLLPVHDELIVQVPDYEAEEAIATIGRLMEQTFHGVHIAADPEVYGASWGSGYKCPPEEDATWATINGHAA